MFVISNNALGKGGFVPPAGTGHLLSATGYPATLKKTLAKAPESINVYGAIGGVGDEYSILPDGYTQLASISCTGTQYIDTDVIPFSNNADSFKFEMIFRDDTARGSLYMMGNRTTDSGVVSAGIGGSNAAKTILVAKTEASTLDNYRVAGHIYKITAELTRTQTGSATIECLTTGEKFTGAQTAFDNVKTTLKVFGYASNQLNNGSSLYSLRMWSDGVLIRDFIPAQNSGDEAGLYDVVNDVFYTNQGTGDFTAGGALCKIPLTVSGNLYDISSYPPTMGKYVNGSNGNINNSNSFALTKYIPCEHLQGKTVTLNKRLGRDSNVPGIAFYSDTKAYISGEVNGNSRLTTWTFTVPNIAYYMRITILANETDIMLNYGSTALPYEAYFEPKIYYLYTDTPLTDTDVLELVPKSKTATRYTEFVPTDVSVIQDWTQDFKLPKAELVTIMADTEVEPGDIEVRYWSKAKEETG